MNPHGYESLGRGQLPSLPPGGYKYRHIYVAETVLGRPLPSKAEVHHVDGNPRNNANSNLVICENHAYHALLHVRAAIVRAGGNPNTEKMCRACGFCKPLGEFNLQASNKSHGRRCYCRRCDVQRTAAWKKAHKKQGSA